MSGIFSDQVDEYITYMYFVICKKVKVGFKSSYVWKHWSCEHLSKYDSTKYRFSKSFVLTTTPLSWMINALYTVETREGRSYIAMKMHFFPLRES